MLSLKYFQEFGYNCHHGRCGFIPNKNEKHDFAHAKGFYALSVLSSIDFTVTSLIIFLSYGYILIYVLKNHQNLKKNMSSSRR